MSARKFLIACGGLQAGEDGVGDYSQRLAEALRDLGHACLVLALNDRTIDREVAVTCESSIQLIRLPESLGLAAKSRRARSIVAAWNPDWVSLQFVSYGFARRGFAVRE